MSKDNNELVFVPLGGVGEIGMNFAMYGYGPANNRKWIIVDVGVTFPGPHLPGVDLVLPDIRYVETVRQDIEAIIITHAHEDHYGAVLSLYPIIAPDGDIPVYMTPFGAGMLESKATGEFDAPKVPIKTFNAGGSFKAGPFEIQAVSVTHSIPEPVSLCIRTPLGNVVHTGDWKNDIAPSMGPLTDREAFTALGDEGVLALICDSTNAMREGESPSEQEVSAGLQEVIEKATGRVAVTTFSSNVGRIKSIAQAAEQAGRRTLLLGRSMKRVVDVATELGYMENVPEFLSEEEYAYIARDKVVVILTGSQGESRAALAKLSRDEMRDIKLNAGDTVVYSSRSIPGNEKPILETKNRLIDMGVTIIEDGADALVHVSGHPRRKELREMYEWTRPQIGIPVHGEAAHLVAHASLMRECGIKEVMDIRNGDMVRLAPNHAEVIDDVPFGEIYKDGRVIGDADAVGVTGRRRLSFAGHVVASIVLDKHYALATNPQLHTIGIPATDDRGEDLEDIIYDIIVNTVESLLPKKRKDLDLVEDAISRAVRAGVRNIWGKKPITTIMVDRV